MNLTWLSYWADWTADRTGNWTNPLLGSITMVMVQLEGCPLIIHTKEACHCVIEILMGLKPSALALSLSFSHSLLSERKAAIALACAIKWQTSWLGYSDSFLDCLSSWLNRLTDNLTVRQEPCGIYICKYVKWNPIWNDHSQQLPYV